jgi:hypothetical protein
LFKIIISGQRGGAPSYAVSSDSSAGTSGAPRKKGPRELTSFPPYTSPPADKSDAGPERVLSSMGQGEKSGSKPDLASSEEAASASKLAQPVIVDYGPVEQMKVMEEGRHYVCMSELC